MDNLTRVELALIPCRINIWLCFGNAVAERSLHRLRRMLYFAPESVFGIVDWHSNRFGTTVQQLFVLRALGHRARMDRVERVLPGAECLLRVGGGQKVAQVLTLIDGITDQGIDPAAVSPNYWRVVHNRLAVCLEPRIYTMDAHAAYVARLALGR